MDVVKEYKIFRGPAGQLTIDISNALADGWQPYGPPAISDHKECSCPIIFQVMVKYEEG